MKWFGITGTWKVTNDEVENDVRTCVRDIVCRGEGIVNGGALGVDYYATDEALRCDGGATHIKVFIPTTLDKYSHHFEMRANEGVISNEQAELLIAQLRELKRRNSDALIEGREDVVLNTETYFNRNTDVVNASDELHAFQVNESAGTQDTIEKAQKVGKKFTLKRYTIL